MELILQQMPIVVHSLNIGFLQTLRLPGRLYADRAKDHRTADDPWGSAGGGEYECTGAGN